MSTTMYAPSRPHVDERNASGDALVHQQSKNQLEVKA